MPRIIARGVVFDHGVGRPFPKPFDLDLGPGWTGLVGHNGAGKTTLLRLISGELQPAAGELRVEPDDAQMLAQISQTSPTLAAGLRRFARDWSSEAGQLRSRLGLDEAQLDDWDILSPGRRKCWQLGAALASRPTVLLCDEPTNHLDAHSRRLLLQALGRFDGLGVVVSHDRELLDELCCATVFVGAGGRVEQRRGAYSEAAAEREREREHALAVHGRHREQERARGRQVEAARRRQASTVRSRRSSTRKRDHRDHDASSAARKSRSEHAAASAEASVRRAQAAHARARAKLAVIEEDHEHQRSCDPLFVDWVPPRMHTLVNLDLTSLAEVAPHPATRLPGDGPVVVGREDRVHLRGPNGAGKTSLLRALHARAQQGPAAGRVLWLAQELDASERRGLLTQLRGLDREQRGRVLQIVAAAGVDPDVLLATPDPSPGEARKLALALGLARRAWLLLLDEPTNHLDLPALGAVERMLLAYPGALVLTCHDRRFAQALTRRRWDL